MLLQVFREVKGKRLPLISSRPSRIVDLERLSSTIKELELLAECSHPWPLDFSRIDEIKILLKQFKNGELDALIAATHTAYAPVDPQQQESTELR